MPARLAAALLGSSLILASAALAQPILPPAEEPPPPSPPAGGGGQTAGLLTVTPEAVAHILKDVAPTLNFETIKSEWTDRVRGEKKELQSLRIANLRGFIVFIVFYGPGSKPCNPEGCASILIRAGFKAHSRVNLQFANTWNLNWRFARLYLDNNNDYYLDMDVNCQGGITRDNIISNLRTYELLLTKLTGKDKSGEPEAISEGGGGGGRTAGLQTVTPEEIAGVVKELGPSLQVEATKLGEIPGLRIAKLNGFPVLIVFYDCGTDGCVSIQLLTSGIAPSHVDLRYANNWNLKWRYSKLYLDNDKNYFFAFDVNCAGGVTRNSIVANLRIYATALEQLKKPPL